MAHPSRAAESRAANLRPVIGGEGGSQLSVDTTALDRDFELMWATASIYGADLRENLRTQMQSRGFVPVMASELPNEASPLLPGEKRDEHDLIRRGACVLMKRPRRVGQAERADLLAQNDEAIRSVNRDFDSAIQGKEGLERLPESGVKSRIERGTATRGSFQE